MSHSNREKGRISIRPYIEFLIFLSLQSFITSSLHPFHSFISSSLSLLRDQHQQGEAQNEKDHQGQDAGAHGAKGAFQKAERKQSDDQSQFLRHIVKTEIRCGVIGLG